MTNRQLQAEKTKEKIYKTTMQLLKTHSADEIKITDIVKEAGISVGSFYNYYSSKMDVFSESHRLEDNYFEQKVEPMLIQEDIQSRLYYFFDQYAYYNSHIANVSVVRYALASNHIHLSRSYDRGMLGVLRRTVQRGIDDYQLKNNESAEDMARFMVISGKGLVDNWCTREGDYDLQVEMRKFVQKFIQLFVYNAN